MSIYNIYVDEANDRIIKYDSNSKNIFWSKHKQGINISNEIQTELNNLLLEKVISKEKDIEIISLHTNNNVTRKKDKEAYFLYNGNDVIGLLDIQMSPKKVKDIKMNGCIFIIYADQSIKRIIFFVIKECNKMAKDYNNNRDWISKSSNKDKKNEINDEHLVQESFVKSEHNIETQDNESILKYCEATIKIPIVEYSANDDKIDKILKIAEQLNNKINIINENMIKTDSKDSLESNFNNKNFYNNLVNENIELKKRNNSLIRERNELLETSNSLVNERKFLTNEIQKSRLYAINEMAKELKPATVYIESQFDLDLQRDIFSEIIEIINRSVGENLKEGIVENLEVINEIKEFSNNIESKIQALREIRDLFKKVNIMSNNNRVGGDSK